MRHNLGDGFVHDRGRDHQPDRARFFELAHKILERRRSDCLVFYQFFNYLWRPVEYHAIVAVLNEPPHHVRSHPSKTDHSELHRTLLFPKTHWIVEIRFATGTLVAISRPCLV